MTRLVRLRRCAFKSTREGKRPANRPTYRRRRRGAILSTAILPGWLGVIGLPIGVALLIGTLEFVGPNEKDGWALAGMIVPIAYIGWSLWLVALGVFLLL